MGKILAIGFGAILGLLCPNAAHGADERGLASIYSGGKHEGGSRAANGERIDTRALTAAHRSLPFGTGVKVVNLKNGKSVLVRINDRGPFVRGRIIDLTPAGASELGISGLAPVRLELVW